MTYKENITAILECYFSGFNEGWKSGSKFRTNEIAESNSKEDK